VVKAAEAGHSGDPNDYRDFLLPPPANRRILCTEPWQLLSHTPQRVHLRVLRRGKARIAFAGGELRELQGHIRELEVLNGNGQTASVRVSACGPFVVDPPHVAGVLQDLTAARRAG
jgi:hypothetical protein